VAGPACLMADRLRAPARAAFPVASALEGAIRRARTTIEGVCGLASGVVGLAPPRSQSETVRMTPPRMAA
jgi:hypothetical protein